MKLKFKHNFTRIVKNGGESVIIIIIILNLVVKGIHQLFNNNGMYLFNLSAEDDFLKVDYS